MRRYFLLLGCLVPALAASQGLTTNAPGVTGGGKVLASFPLSTSGGLITEDANTVAHVYWNGTALVDTKGNSWTQNGTVPQVTANPFTTTRYGAGPFGTANYYSLGTGADVLDFAGDFTVCAVMVSGVASSEMIIDQHDDSTTGWRIRKYSDGGCRFQHGSAFAYTGAGNVVGGPNVICGGRSGSTLYVKNNLGTTATQNVGTYSLPTAIVPMMGRAVVGGQLLEGKMYEFYATSTPFTEATVIAIQQKVLGHFDGSAPLAVIRATLATYVGINGTTRFTVPAGVARITSTGLLDEPLRIQYVKNNSTHPKTAEDTAAVGTGAHVAWAEGTGNFTVAVNTATATGLPCTQAVGTLCSFTVTGAGTLAVTTDATVTTASVENGATKTSFIPTTTTATQRNADVVTFTAPAGTTWETLTNSGTRSGAAASPGTITLPNGTISNVKVCGKAKKIGDCK